MSSEAAFYIGLGIMMWAIIILYLAVQVVSWLRNNARRIWRDPLGFFRRRRRRSSTERPPSHLTGQEPSRAQNVGSGSEILGTLPTSSPGRLPIYFTGEEPSSVQNVRLDSAILETLPTFLIESPNFNDLCTVCQYAFEENEKARLLPNCGHVFHVHCIDKWFDSSSTCPVCRTVAEPKQPILESARIEQVSDTISERITSGINSEQGQNASSGEEFNLQNPTAISSSGRQKQMNAEMDEGTSAGRGFSTRVEAHRSCSPNGSQSSSRSPVTRLRSPNGSQSSSRSPVTPLNSPTSIASRDRESIPVLPSDHPAECNDENNNQ